MIFVVHSAYAIGKLFHLLGDIRLALLDLIAVGDRPFELVARCLIRFLGCPTRCSAARFPALYS